MVDLAISKASSLVDEELLKGIEHIDMSDIGNKQKKPTKQPTALKIKKKPSMAEDTATAFEGTPPKKPRCELSAKRNSIYSTAYRKAQREGKPLSECQAAGREAAAKFKADYERAS